MLQALEFMDKAMLNESDPTCFSLHLRIQFDDIAEELLTSIQSGRFENNTQTSDSQRNLVHIDYYHQGMRWLRSKSFNKANYCFSKAMKFAPDSSILYVGLALVYAEIKQYHLSELALEKAHVLLVAEPKYNRLLISKVSHLRKNVSQLVGFE